MKRETHNIDATNKVFGRLATEIAVLLRGKHKPTFAPNVDGGDTVVVENVAKMAFSGKKLENKVYHRHTQYPGNLKSETLGERMKRNPAKVLSDTVRHMLPDNKLRSGMMKRLIIK